MNSMREEKKKCLVKILTHENSHFVVTIIKAIMIGFGKISTIKTSNDLGHDRGQGAL